MLGDKGLGYRSCPWLSMRVHSRYRRRLTDHAVGGRAVEIRLQVSHGWWQAPIAGWRYGQNERKSWFADDTTASRETPSTPEIAYWGLPSEEWLDDWRSTTKLPSRLIDALADAEPQLSGVELTWKGRPVAAAERIEHMATGRPTRLVTEPEAPWGWWSLDDWDNCADEQFLTAFGDRTNHR
ncbi:hypothetical protein [Nocardia gamkensis]|uniref:Uncharacterized protein n=2 Tax=Nocardia gamkensis TaxID=352869 RepID=A0A7X6L198_9NOCA|nr:hypothetical protein [Nocardia gamkensis]NKY25895.1 hypothetical protein [Nocardia gamkensis]